MQDISWQTVRAGQFSKRASFPHSAYRSYCTPAHLPVRPAFSRWGSLWEWTSQSRFLFDLTLQIQEEAHIQHDAHRSRRGGGQADIGQAGVGPDAHEVGHGQTNQQGLDQALDHDPNGFVIAVEVANHAEKHSRDQRLGCKAFQVGVGICNNLSVRGKGTGQQVALQHDEGKDEAADHKADANAGEHGFLGAPPVAGTDVLGNERCHRLHQGAGHQHRKVDDLAGNAIAGGSRQPQTINESAQCQERQLGQKLLQSQRQTDGKELAALAVQTQIRFLDLKGHVLFQQDDNRADHADSLSKHGGNGGTGGIQMEPRHQHHIECS